MKRLSLFVLALCALGVGQVFAQNSTSPITLNDATPAIDVSITLPPDATGVIALDLTTADVKLVDAGGNTVFTSADPRVHMIELSIAPNTGNHTLTVSRLPGVQQASVRVHSQANLTPAGSASLVQTNQIGLQQQHTLTLSALDTGGHVMINLPQGTTSLIAATFPGAQVTSQVTDDAGSAIANSYRDVDGFNMVVDGGTYDVSLLVNRINNDVTARVTAGNSDAFALLPAPQVVNRIAPVTIPCTATITSSSVNLRSGPGTAYTVVNFGFLGDTYQVGGVNPTNDWLVISTNSGSAWVSRGLTMLDGDCSHVPVYNVPQRNAQQ